MLSTSMSPKLKYVTNTKIDKFRAIKRSFIDVDENLANFIGNYFIDQILMLVTFLVNWWQMFMSKDMESWRQNGQTDHQYLKLDRLKPVFETAFEVDHLN